MPDLIDRFTPLDANCRHVVHYLDTARDRSDTYTVIDAGLHVAAKTPIVILAEPGRSDRETVTLDSYGTPLEDRADVRLEPDTYADGETTALGEWQDRLTFTVLEPAARRGYRDDHAAADEQASLIEDLFTEDGTAGLYRPHDAVLSAFRTFVETGETETGSTR